MSSVLERTESSGEVVGAVVGVVVGAAVGVAVGAVVGTVVGAAVGVAVGTVVGAVVGVVVGAVVGAGAHPSGISISRAGIQILTSSCGGTVRFMMTSLHMNIDRIQFLHPTDRE